MLAEPPFSALGTLLLGENFLEAAGTVADIAAIYAAHQSQSPGLQEFNKHLTCGLSIWRFKLPFQSRPNIAANVMAE